MDGRAIRVPHREVSSGSQGSTRHLETLDYEALALADNPPPSPRRRGVPAIGIWGLTRKLDQT